MSFIHCFKCPRPCRLWTFRQSTCLSLRSRHSFLRHRHPLNWTTCLRCCRTTSAVPNCHLMLCLRADSAEAVPFIPLHIMRPCPARNVTIPSLSLLTGQPLVRRTSVRDPLPRRTRLTTTTTKNSSLKDPLLLVTTMQRPATPAGKLFANNASNPSNEDVMNLGKVMPALKKPSLPQTKRLAKFPSSTAVS